MNKGNKFTLQTHTQRPCGRGESHSVAKGIDAVWWVSRSQPHIYDLHRSWRKLELGGGGVGLRGRAPELRAFK